MTRHVFSFFFFQAEDGIRDSSVTGVQTLLFRSHAIMFLDLDQFKVVNDTCGHMAGDSLLLQLGATLKDNIRGTDTLARLGGDEFGVLLMQCNESKAYEIAEKLRQAITDFRFVWNQKVFETGMSIGVSLIS